MYNPNSVYPSLPSDTRSYLFTPDLFGARPDGTGDNAVALQAAIDHISDERTFGVLFIPEGQYRLGQMVNLWRGIRLIGIGANRPVFILGPDTPGYDQGVDRYMIYCRDRKPTPQYALQDAQNSSFYSGIRNIDFRIETGNPGAVAVRFRVAQLSSLEFIDFDIRDGLAAVEAVGNQVQHCRFSGGRFGIRTGRTSPWWQALVADCLFEGQKDRCIDTHEAGLTVVRCTFRDAPEAVTVPEMEVEQLYMKDCHLERISDAGISMSLIRNSYNHLNLENITCQDVPRFFDIQRFQYNPHLIHKPVDAPATRYRVEEMQAGLHILCHRDKEIPFLRRPELHVHLRPIGIDEPDAVTTAGDPLPPMMTISPMEQWCNVRDFGARGDGVSDDTDAFREAVESGRVVYVPMGTYRLTDTLILRPDTCLIGLHCHETQIVAADHTPVFDDPNTPASLVEVPENGICQIRGIGFNGGCNRGITALRWLGAPESVLEDVFFHFGGRGGMVKGTSQQHALLIENGGAGIFQNIWIPDVLSRDGLHVRHTDRPGQIWLVSVEHHQRVDVVFDHVKNWRIHALQTEADRGSESALSLRLTDCEDLVFSNLFQYRVMAIDLPYPEATTMDNCRNILFRGVHIFSQGSTPFDSMVRIDGQNRLYEREAAYVWFE